MTNQFFWVVYIFCFMSRHDVHVKWWDLTLGLVSKQTGLHNLRDNEAKGNNEF